MIHELKTWPNAFAGLYAGLKTHEVRRNDRPFGLGHKLRLQEWDPQTKEYTGREVWREVIWITDPSVYSLEMTSDVIVMSVRPCPAPVYTDEQGPDVPHDHRD